MREEDIVYKIAEQQLAGELPTDSDANQYNFTFEQLEQINELLRKNKPFKFVAKLTPIQKAQINGTIENDTDNADAIFMWDSDEWHYDYLKDDYDKEVGTGYLLGHIYFVRSSDAEKVTESNFEEKMENFSNLTIEYSSIVNEALKTLTQAWAKIDELNQ